MSHDTLRWVLETIKQLEQAKFSGEVTLSLFQGQLKGTMKQTMHVKQP